MSATAKPLPASAAPDTVAYDADPNTGFAVFDIQYRLAPQPNWRTATGDVKCAIGWVKRHARETGVDVDAC